MPSLQRLPNEILLTILESMPDFVSLRKFTLAYPLASELLAKSHKAIFRSLIAQIEPLEYRNLVSATLAARYNPRAVCCGYPTNENDDHTCDEPRPLDIGFTIQCIADPIEAVRDIALTFRDMEYFTITFYMASLRYWDLGGPTTTEEYRIRRALWTFQFLSEVAYPRSTLGIQTQRRQNRNSEVRMRWLTYDLGWQYVEMECLFLHLCEVYHVLAILPARKGQKKLPLRSQPPVVQRLATNVGFSLDDPTPDRLDSGRRGESTKANFLRKTFPTSRFLYVGFRKWPDYWHDGYVDTHNYGWELLAQQQWLLAQQQSWIFGFVAWPVNRRGQNKYLYLQKRGFCIWDRQRFDDWDLVFTEP